MSPPAEWYLSSVCEMFGVPLVPGGAVDQPIALALDVAELRAYRDAVRAVDEAERQEDVPKSEAVDWVLRVQAEKLRRRNAARAKAG